MPLALAPLQVGVSGGVELAVALPVAVLLFGADELPEASRSTGKAPGEYRKGRDAIERELRKIEETAGLDTELSDTREAVATRRPTGRSEFSRGRP